MCGNAYQYLGLENVGATVQNSMIICVGMLISVFGSVKQLCNYYWGMTNCMYKHVLHEGVHCNVQCTCSMRHMFQMHVHSLFLRV